MQKMKSCMIIDDDQDDQEIFFMCVRKISNAVSCTAANDGVIALMKLKADTAYTPDYIFLDVNMPKMNGTDCLKELKKIDRLKNTRIFMYSTASDTRIFDESKKLGADGFIVKPASSAELTRKLYNIFKPV